MPSMLTLTLYANLDTISSPESRKTVDYIGSRPLGRILSIISDDKWLVGRIE